MIIPSVYKVRVKVKMTSTSEGGRRQPIKEGYRGPILLGLDKSEIGSIEEMRVKRLDRLSESVELAVNNSAVLESFLYPDDYSYGEDYMTCVLNFTTPNNFVALYACPESFFAIFEGVRIVGCGEIVDIVELIL